MIPGLLAVAVALALVPSEPDRTATAVSTTHLVRMIGEQVSFDAAPCLPYRWEREDPDPEGHFVKKTGCQEDDLQYVARYRVRMLIDGEASESIEFLATGWTSHYADSRHALLTLVMTPDGWLLPPGLAVSVYPTSDGGWASCDDDDGSEPVEFAGDLVFGRTDGMSPYGISQRFPSSDYVVVGREAFCIRGRQVPALVEAIDSDLEQLRKSGFDHLPPAATQAASP